MPATVKRHANVLQHLAGFCREHLSAWERGELAGLIGDYRNGLVPLVVPLTLLRHHVERHDVAYVRGQLYLAPHPKELMLRNHVWRAPGSVVSKRAPAKPAADGAELADLDRHAALEGDHLARKR